MTPKSTHKFRKTAIIFSLMLVYIIAALVWWFILIEKQNDEMHAYKLHHLNSGISPQSHPGLYKSELYKIEDEYRRNKIKYAGEGIVFLGLIILGSFYIYRSLRQQVRMQAQQQNFMMAVTHELKTPIAVARLNLETLLKHRLEEEQQIKMIRITLDETKRLDFLTNNILISAQLDSRGYKINREELDLSSLLSDRVKEFRSRFSLKIFNEQIEDDCAVNGDALLLQILINNLLENAVKYSGNGETITTILGKSNGIVELSVADEGPGVPDHEKKNIFNKFYRIGNENTRSAKGSGLGLYLCKKIAADHNADILVTDNEPNGSIFVVKFKDLG